MIIDIVLTYLTHCLAICSFDFGRGDRRGGFDNGADDDGSGIPDAVKDFIRSFYDAICGGNQYGTWHASSHRLAYSNCAAVLLPIVWLFWGMACIHTEITRYYESEWKTFTDRYFASSRWPQHTDVEDLFDEGT